jgi:hypothetical protein
MWLACSWQGVIRMPLQDILNVAKFCMKMQKDVVSKTRQKSAHALRRWF